jgi:hypothetical protein
MTDVDFSSIPKPGQKCAICGCDLAQVSKHPSVLQTTESGNAERRDVCPACWEKMPEHDFLSFWLSRREPPRPDPRLSREQQRAALMRLFEQMLTANEPRLRAHLYVLAHTLMKRRMLKWEGSEKGEDGIEQIVFRNLATDELIRIEEIDLEDASLVAVMRDIEGALAGDAAADAVAAKKAADQAEPASGEGSGEAGGSS